LIGLPATHCQPPQPVVIIENLFSNANNSHLQV
jgi:hypothetical protein